ncbi:hypothetical protein [Brevibacillus sp. MER 51]|uniref:hypothetical protein n=1 Tax=Brevibacillus sp. MER 51 TaxID=2939560 RepID=UPI00203F30AB|nr:hypothetical protein [Brevibacillus sp. MER 51]MCM3141332.1 hypothetical protein [Brevibacillus sp. MER 51]
MQLIQLLRTLPITPFEDYGSVISFADIVNACSIYGQHNSNIIEIKLKELEKQGKLAVVYMKDPGFEELIVGVKLT